MIGHTLTKVWFNFAARVLTAVPQKTPILLTGPGSVKLLPSELDTLKAKRPLIVTDTGVAGTDILKSVEKILKDAGVQYAVHKDIKADPSFEVCRAGLEALRAQRCDAVIALGGGSVMDAGKLIRMGATHDKPMEKFAGIMRLSNGGLPFICIPTTAGTGSEATAAAVITDTKRHRKVTVLNPRIPPDSAILDPSLTLGLPSDLTASTGVNALAHAIEAYTNTLHYSDVDSQAVEAVRLILAYLPKVYANPADARGREALLRASNLAGRAFTRGFLGYVHAIAQRFGEKYHIPHGLANAIVLPYFLDLYAEACPQRLASLARATAICGDLGQGKDKDCAKAFVEAVKTLLAGLGIPCKADFLKADDIEAIAKEALREAHGTPYPVPVVYMAKELAAILRTMLP